MIICRVLYNLEETRFTRLMWKKYCLPTFNHVKILSQLLDGVLQGLIHSLDCEDSVVPGTVC